MLTTSEKAKGNGKASPLALNKVNSNCDRFYATHLNTSESKGAPQDFHVVTS